MAALAEASQAGSATSAANATQHGQKGKTVASIVLGMAGSGKTTLMQRINAHVHERNNPSYMLNLDPAVLHVPYKIHIDIRDTVNYKEVMKQYSLGPNGAIITSLNLFATRVDKVISILEKRAPEKKLDYIFCDTPGQIEVFTWSASGNIITQSLATAFPTVLLYVIDTPRSTSCTTFMSNMLYACSILYKLKLPFIIVFNKIDVAPHDFAVSWMEDFELFQEALEKERDQSYMSSMLSSMSMVLDEFYKSLRCVGVSAATGEGMDELFHAIEEASKEYYQDYLPALEKRIAEVAKARSNLASACNENGQSNATARGNGSERDKIKHGYDVDVDDGGGRGRGEEDADIMAELRDEIEDFKAIMEDIHGKDTLEYNEAVEEGICQMKADARKRSRRKTKAL